MTFSYPTDWEITTIGDYFDVYAGGDWDKDNSHRERSETHKYPVFANAHVGQGIYGYANYWKANENTITVTGRGDVGLATYRTEKYVPIVRLITLDPKNGEECKFFSYFINNRVEIQSESTGVPQLTAVQISKYLIPVPKLNERISIAEALSDIDELIESIDAEIRKKRNILKGFQQSLISGDYFKKNNISFEIVQIQNLPIEIKRGQLITGTTKVDGNIPVIAGGISAAYFHNIANRFGTTITISASGANAGFVNLWRSDIWASDCSTIGESEVYEVLYIFYVLKEKQKELFDAQYGGGQPHIRPKEIGEISIPWISKANQKDLMVILEGLSKEIELLETELAKYECIKQGMAHDLLTGKVRLV